MSKFFRQLFCKHYFQLTKDPFNRTGARQMNAMGYYSKESTCCLCGKTVEHD